MVGGLDFVRAIGAEDKPCARGWVIGFTTAVHTGGWFAHSASFVWHSGQMSVEPSTFQPFALAAVNKRVRFLK